MWEDTMRDFLKRKEISRGFQEDKTRETYRRWRKLERGRKRNGEEVHKGCASCSGCRPHRHGSCGSSRSGSFVGWSKCRPGLVKCGPLGQDRLLGPFDHLVFNSSSPMPAHLHCPLRCQHVHRFSAESRSSFGFLDLEQLALNEIIEA